MNTRLRTLKVLLVEDNPIKEQLKARYEELFEEAGYQASIEMIECNLTKVQQTIQASSFHVVITDLSFNDMNALEGLKLAKWIKEKRPSILVIANSGENFTISKFIGVGMDIFVPKSKLLTKDIAYRSIALEEFRRKFRLNTELFIAGNAIEENFKAADREEVKLLISECLFTSHSFDEEFDPSFVELDALTKGFSDSRVFSVKSGSKEGEFQHIQAVVKVSRKDKAREELERFHRFVKWTLPYDWRVDVLGSAFGAKFGAVCYSFVSAENEKFYDLEHYIITADFERVLAVIDRIMDTSSRKWYRGDLYSNYSSIAETYGKRYFDSYGSDVQKSQEIFEREIREILDFVPISGRVYSKDLDVEFMLPAEGVYSRFDAECQTCIGHGDLHARNIILSEKTNGKIVFIDFQQTGRCHVFEDFIVFESSIRLHYPDCAISEAEQFELEQKLNSGADVGENLKYQLLQKVRQRAFEHFDCEPQQNYVFGALSFNLRLLREKKVVGEARRNLLIAIASACCFFAERESSTKAIE